MNNAQKMLEIGVPSYRGVQRLMVFPDPGSGLANRGRTSTGVRERLCCQKETDPWGGGGHRRSEDSLKLGRAELREGNRSSADAQFGAAFRWKEKDSDPEEDWSLSSASELCRHLCGSELWPGLCSRRAVEEAWHQEARVLGKASAGRPRDHGCPLAGWRDCRAGSEVLAS